MPRIGRTLALLVIAAGSAVAIDVLPAGAVGSIQTATWWSGGNGVAPPTLPAGGLWVSYGPDGEHARSALRFQLSGREVFPLVTLRIHNEFPPTVAGVAMCPAAADWHVVTAAPLTAAPKADCSAGAVSGLESADGKTMAFDLASVVPPLAKVVDVVLVAAPKPATVTSPPAPLPDVLPDTQPTPYDVTFEAPRADDIAVGVLPSPELEPRSVDSAGTVEPSFDYSPLPDAAPYLGGTSFPVRDAAGRAPIVPLYPAARTTGLVVVEGLSRRARVAAGLAFVDLALWWYLSAFGSRSGRAVTLYDAASSGNEVADSRARRREGRAPPLR